MSYCVHCGVELEDRAKRCPLCQTPVIDLWKANNTDPVPEIPLPSEQPQRKINRRLLVLLIGLLLLIPLLVVVIINLAMTHTLTWALYVLGSEICFWTIFVLPLNGSGKSPYLYVAVDTAVIALLLLMIYLENHATDWFLPLALPITLLSGAAVLLQVLIWRGKRIGKIRKTGWGVWVIACLLIGLDLTITHYLNNAFGLTWAWYAAFPLLIISVVLLAVSYNKKAVQWLRRNLFV
ncbi:MAG: zinc ribbon domain-containing protein [Oscillospiraceae bacterium]|nr:zinc ribbon domain-containing protein [Oscillospiraceae bacterium]